MVERKIMDEQKEKQEQVTFDDEIDIMDYIRVIVKRKYIIIAVFLFSVILAAIITNLQPKIYRGDVLVNVPKDVSIINISIKGVDIKELISVMGDIKKERLAVILPKTHHLVSSIKITEVVNSKDKIRIVVDTKTKEIIPDALSEFVGYMTNHPLITLVLEQRSREKNLLSKQYEGTVTLIESYREMMKTYKRMFNEGKMVYAGINPLIFEENILQLESRKLIMEFGIKSLDSTSDIKSKDISFLDEINTSRNPVSPNKKKKILLAGFVGLFVGTVLAFLMESIEKYKKS
ncbi:membrane protein containing Lipopolysaccharide biosynthesis domain protein [Candidatus Magnetobacterium bavaricum]|uniref:Membrane protein containing Lipopolysaccharide biosynthesis domain protein n=1 Tax=Candidatus Magnetobacterium bavaricum TaxID=29290 RepID=A0A0F3GVJ2_9BACT|nr:membrane protein containing Lipopolysaccharide biosynthesis domain protein [Candidatus Magnetobacterium bavaricum]